MTTPYTDDDVKAVQATAICGPTQARRLLDAGYRKVAPVDAYPVRPTVTADMVREVWEVLLPRLVAGSYQDAADAFNRLLAERGGER